MGKPQGLVAGLLPNGGGITAWDFAGLFIVSDTAPERVVDPLRTTFAANWEYCATGVHLQDTQPAVGLTWN